MMRPRVLLKKAGVVETVAQRYWSANMGKMHGTEGSQVAGLSVRSHGCRRGDTTWPISPRTVRKPQECRGMGAAIKGGKYQGCK